MAAAIVEPASVLVPPLGSNPADALAFDHAVEQPIRETLTALCDAVRANPFEQDLLTIPITVSIGLALMREGASVEELVSIADRRVYLAKAMGRDRVVDRTSARRAAAPGREPANLPLQSAVV